ncbi:unnamed protein product [Vitrella brassicaformis CCMP3155]|uniref:Mitochondrial carrier protein n=1 Tax=Vitrella brassicaformis (strain CCMP3155) TaxID=1169540 RepID=A0A0G4FFX6_VITBC|nr:unnamed protein product [Vitrella brassicaformis CCMP3155]|eukprot:CEM12127.1 unnamed protein product [Vitrella brassicaformis CCMP3155]
MAQEAKVSAAAALTSSVCTQAALHPFDLIRTRMMVSKVTGGAVPSHRGTISSARAILRAEGIPGLYKGLTATVIASGVSWGLFRYLFDVWRYEIGRYRQVTMAEWRGDGGQEGIPRSSHASFSDNLLASMGASFASTLCVHPLWLLKSRLEMQTFESKSAGWVQYGGWWDCLRTIVRTEGPMSLYRGLGPALGLVPHAAVQLLAYEEIKKRDRRVEGVPLNPIKPFLWGAASKFAASCITFPLQVLRVRQQVQTNPYGGRNFLTVALTMVSEEGVISLYRGFWVHVQRACLHNAVMFLLFERFLGNV